MTMRQQLFLHIGDCKTGSTVVQTMLAGGHVVPQDVRLFYPGQAAHGQLQTSLGSRPDLYPARWQAIARRLASADWDVAVLSSELFEFSQPAKVARALQENLPEYADTVKVIAYIRPHAGRVLSQFAENLKLSHDTGTMAQFLDRFIDTGHLNYTKRLDAWHEQFPGRLIVRPFIRDQLKNGDVRDDFLSIILNGGAYTRGGEQDPNVSLCLADLALVRLLQRRFCESGEVPIENRVAFGKVFGRLLQARAPTGTGEKLGLPRALYERIRAHCLEDAQNMDQTWASPPCFERALETAADGVIAHPQSLEAEIHHSPETLRQTMVWGDLILHQMQDPPKVFGKRMRAIPSRH
ncbi:MAG: hypothetical protein COC12_12950 [Rhodobacteraceae bacterium]|nr:MAG: hypothetical protein COC12_12950 [Paracoccaceae bacterium]